MPVYEFMCLDCRKAFEVVRRISEFDPKRIECPACSGRKVERHWTKVHAITSKKS